LFDNGSIGYGTPFRVVSPIQKDWVGLGKYYLEGTTVRGLLQLRFGFGNPEFATFFVLITKAGSEPESWVKIRVLGRVQRCWCNTPSLDRFLWYHKLDLTTVYAPEKVLYVFSSEPFGELLDQFCGTLEILFSRPRWCRPEYSVHDRSLELMASHGLDQCQHLRLVRVLLSFMVSHVALLPCLLVFPASVESPPSRASSFIRLTLPHPSASRLGWSPQGSSRRLFFATLREVAL